MHITPTQRNLHLRERTKHLLYPFHTISSLPLALNRNNACCNQSLRSRKRAISKDYTFLVFRVTYFACQRVPNTRSLPTPSTQTALRFVAQRVVLSLKSIFSDFIFNLRLSPEIIKTKCSHSPDLQFSLRPSAPLQPHLRRYPAESRVSSL